MPLALAVAPVLAVGCSLDVQAPEAVLWEGELDAVDESGLSGSIAAISRESTTEVGIEVRGGEAGDRWDWLLARGTCDEPGTPVAGAGAFPVLEAEEDESGPGPEAPVSAEGRTILSTPLDRDREHHATVAAESEPDSLLACGEVRPRG